MPISVRQEPLPEPRQVALKTYLGGEGYALLTLVIGSKCTTQVVAAMLPALESRDFDSRLAIANTELQSAHRYQIALDVLKEIKEQQEEYTTAKLS